jgi:hypothetical protein
MIFYSAFLNFNSVTDFVKKDGSYGTGLGVLIIVAKIIVIIIQ